MAHWMKPSLYVTPPPTPRFANSTVTTIAFPPQTQVKRRHILAIAGNPTRHYAACFRSGSPLCSSENTHLVYFRGKLGQAAKSRSCQAGRQTQEQHGKSGRFFPKNNDKNIKYTKIMRTHTHIHIYTHIYAPGPSVWT